MDNRTKSVLAVIAVCTLGLCTVAIVVAFLVLIIILHDGTQTSDLVNKLMDLATGGLVAMAAMVGVHINSLGNQSNTPQS